MYRSEIAWKNANYAQILEYLREEYELNQRFGSLDFKLKFVEVVLSGTEYWGTQRGANNHQTLMLPNRQERNYTSCPTTEGWLHLARPPRAGLRLSRRLGADSASPDVRGLALPRPAPRAGLKGPCVVLVIE